ncbi:MAG: amino acid ABC transporter permease [Bacteroidetes bacterium]|nr:amino acid ABC transporter permease [Bacteroidota bacterium]
MEFSSFLALCEFCDAILLGLGFTIILTIVPTIFGTLIGLAVSPILAADNRKLLFWLFTAIVEVIRAIPPLVWLVWIYFALPIWVGIRLNGLTSSLVVFIAIYGAYAADIFRGAILAIPKTTKESALALGMTNSMVFRRVIFTEVFRRSFPALNGQTIGLIKMSSLASLIAVPELTYSFQLIMLKKPLPFEIYTAMAICYSVLVFPSIFILRKIEDLNSIKLNPSSANVKSKKTV